MATEMRLSDLGCPCSLMKFRNWKSVTSELKEDSIKIR